MTLRPVLVRLLLVRLMGCLLAGAAGAAAAQNTNEPQAPSGAKSDWEEEQERLNWKELDARLPPYPRDDKLVEFRVAADSRFHFFVDTASISSGPDGVVRFTLVARSPSGYANVSYEGIRCATKEYKIFALGGEGRWTAPRASAWRPIEPKAFQRWHNELYTWYLCPRRRPVASAAEGADALRRGGHPAALLNSENER